MMGEPDPGKTERAMKIARQFVRARSEGVALQDFPGAIPDSIEAAYRVQDAAIALQTDEIVGWKVGYIAPEARGPGGDERLVGPIFARRLQVDVVDTVDFPVFAGGFAAVEAELAFRLRADALPARTRWTVEEALAIAGDLHIGIETAGSPLKTINDLGPRVVVSDFGNNAGMLLGPAIEGWRALPAPLLSCQSYVDGRIVGEGLVDTLAAGPLVALAFALSRCARNGRPLRAGDIVTTGALTGIHEIAAGQTARVDFGIHGSIFCRAVDARAWRAAQAIS
ncbi:MAG: 2-keto-4-pentenoate hydratase [Rudaea sp.]